MKKKIYFGALLCAIVVLGAAAALNGCGSSASTPSFTLKTGMGSS